MTEPCHSLLQISDLHLLREATDTLLGVNTEESLRAVLADALALSTPDAVLVTGDIAHAPVAATYRRALAAVREQFDGPVLCLPGNHDVLAPMLEAGLPTGPIDLGEWSVFGLDTHEDDTLAAQLPEPVRAGFETWLGAASGHVLVATHHPLVPVGCPWLDPDRLPGADALIEQLAAFNDTESGAKVQGIVFGHAHQEVEAERFGIQLLGAPSTCFQFRPKALKFSIDDLSPGCRWLDLYPDGSLTSRIQRADYQLHIDLKDRGNH